MPVAVDSVQTVIDRWGHPVYLNRDALAFVTDTGDLSDPVIFWVSPRFTNYKEAWALAADMGLVDPLSEWGNNVDLDHVFAKSWAALFCDMIKFVRLFPVYAGVNRDAGATLEKFGLKHGVTIEPVDGIVFANEMQILKMLGLKVGTFDDPVEIFK